MLRVVPDFAPAIAECLALHAEAMDRLGTDYPERLSRVPVSVKEKMSRQRERAQTLDLDQVQSLNAGLRLILRKLAPRAPEPPRPPMPTWNDNSKRWEIL
jgi:hypothetical protein